MSEQELNNSIMENIKKMYYYNDRFLDPPFSKIKEFISEYLNSRRSGDYAITLLKQVLPKNDDLYTQKNALILCDMITKICSITNSGKMIFEYLIYEYPKRTILINKLIIHQLTPLFNFEHKIQTKLPIGKIFQKQEKLLEIFNRIFNVIISLTTSN